MKILRGIFFATFIAIMLMTLFSLIPTIQLDQNAATTAAEPGLGQPVFRYEKPILLTRDEMVPFLKHIALHYRYKKVSMESQRLFIDIKVKKEQFDPDTVSYTHLTLPTKA